uniref:ATP synthase mitochondrial F1 complex assembly factor 2 n=1 Tax=Heterorhabditis bacteriophora TaxID=37862 RepID=A0A1I7X7U3_HETBA
MDEIPQFCLDNGMISPLDYRTIEKWLLSHNFYALIGLQYAVEAVKSVLIPYNVLSFNLTATEAVHRAALERKVQSETWGTVEWAHSVEEAELTARLSAAVLFVYFNVSKSTTSVA